MKFFLLELRETAGWGKVVRGVVRAESEERARELMSKGGGTEGEQAWLRESESSCEVLRKGDGEGVVIRESGPPANK